jgi:hypothetical protein
MAMFMTAEAVRPLASVTPKVRVLVPAFAGMPDRTPEVVKPRPELQAPEQPLTAQVYGVVPLVAVRESL